MKKKTTTPQCCAALAALLLLSVSLFAQPPKSPNPIKGYGDASYTLAQSEQFMTTWLVAGPVPVTKPVDEKNQQALFKLDIPTVEVNGKKRLAPLNHGGAKYHWEVIRSEGDVIDLDKHYNGADFSVAIAMAEIVSDRERKVLLGVGSDDGVRVWHNGKLVHDNWIPRAVEKDADVVPITLAPGSNQIILKIQDLEQGWGFAVRVMNADAQSAKLVDATRSGNVDIVAQLLEAGARVDHTDPSGLTALHHARLSGREDIARMLRAKGAKDTPLPPLDRLIDGLYNSVADALAAGASVLVSKDGEVLYEKGFGYADIAGKLLITPETRFRIGSITKQFTASAILKLQEEGRLSLTDKLSKYAPGFPRGDEVTLHHLLTHTSGIRSYTSKPEFLEKVTSPIPEEELIAFFRDDPYDFDPGAQYMYNNSGYFLLGHIIGKVTGKPYGEYLRETFFEPLGMTNTGVHRSDLVIEREAKGYTKEGNEYKLTLNWDMSWAGGAGALYSTVGDLHLWNEALFSGRVLSAASMKAAFSPAVLNNGKVTDNPAYGYGWVISDYRGRRVLEHSGGLHGFAAQLAWFPQDRITVTILTNLMPPELNLNPYKIAEFIIWDKMNAQNPGVLDSMVTEDVTPYVGRYDFGNGAVMMITAEDNKLFAQLSGQTRFPIFPSGPGEYFWKVVNAKIKFVRNASGVVEYGEFEQNGRKLNVPKLTDRPVVSIDKNLYKLYAGKYDYGNNMVITVFVEGDKIYAQPVNQPRVELLPVSDQEFVVRELNASLVFVKDGDKVSKMILDLGGRKQEGPRVAE